MTSKLAEETNVKSHRSAKQNFRQRFSGKRWKILSGSLLPKPLRSFSFSFAPLVGGGIRTPYRSFQNLKSTRRILCWRSANSDSGQWLQKVPLYPGVGEQNPLRTRQVCWQRRIKASLCPCTLLLLFLLLQNGHPRTDQGARQSPPQQCR